MIVEGAGESDPRIDIAFFRAAGFAETEFSASFVPHIRFDREEIL
ncbi:MAG TPA: hypothetical protein VMN36_02850 [Verrucomicrobiales bacterium]|nr:hypothetical protein [Verrucomicrobiales bacterium]